MKKIALLLFISTAVLSACQDDKAENTASTEVATSEMVTKTSTEPKVEAAPKAESTGESIHQANCTKCHNSEVYTRADHKVTSLEGLGKQVRMCDTQLETQLFPEDLDKVITYLNETYYKF